MDVFGSLWADDVPVGFAHVEVIEPEAAHLEEIDAHPDHGRRGLGAKLICEVCQWAANNGYSAVMLTTTRESTIASARAASGDVGTPLGGQAS